MKIGNNEVALVKPRLWDLVAMAVLGVGVALAGASMGKALTDGATAGRISDGFALTLALLQMAICLGSLMILGKTAKDGTIWGNLAAVGGLFVGMSGVLLAATLWAAA